MVHLGDQCLRRAWFGRGRVRARSNRGAAHECPGTYYRCARFCTNNRVRTNRRPKAHDRAYRSSYRGA